MLNAVALGTFDGLHSGHRAVIDSIKAYRRIAFTFKLPPKAVLNGKTELLMTPDEKYQALLDYGIDEAFMPDFSEMKDVTAAEFLELIKKEYNPAAIACGFNYRFGLKAMGDTELLKSFCKENKIEFYCAPPVIRNNMPVSSSHLRSLIKDGKVDEANKEIFGGFSFSAEVIHGDHRGTSIGYPTINQAYPEALVQARFGVYETEVLIDGVPFKSITNLGKRPTFKTENIMAETYIPKFSGDLYGRRVKITLKRFLRKEKKFSSLYELKEAIDNDVAGLFQ